MSEASGATPPSSTSEKQLTTGVPGLDQVLGGGFVEHGLYLIEGHAGTGKTILAMQTAFHQARQGARVLYVTLIAEAHGKLLRHIRNLGFFEDALIARQINLISGYRTLVEDGLDGLIRFIAEIMREHAPDLMILDGFRSARDFSETRLELAKFIHELNTLVTAERCTTLLLAPMNGTTPQPEHTLVDGLIELTRYTSGLRGVREFQVHKMRGADHMEGRHVFRITDQGLRIYPRLEAVVHDAFAPPEVQTGTLAFGIESLDAMLRGGLIAGSTTSLLGAPGSGKTLLGLKFLHAGLQQGEPAIYFGFFESPQRLLAKAASVGIDLREAAESGLLQILWQPPLEFHMDELAERLLGALEARPETTRLLVDGIEGFTNDSIHEGRSADFLAALSTKLRMGSLTTIFTEEMPLFGEQIGVNAFRFSATVENILLLRYVEIHSRVRRFISIMKLRDSDYDQSIREFEIHSHGIEVTSRFEFAEAILTGQARVFPRRVDDEGNPTDSDSE